MNSKALDQLFRTIHFDNYIQENQDHKHFVSELVSKYDYQSVIDNLIKYVNSRRFDSFYSFKSQMLKGLQPKKKDCEYIEQENKLEASITEMVNENFISLERNSKRQFVEEYELYNKYTFTYLRQISLERHISVSRLCEIKGLIPIWLLIN